MNLNKTLRAEIAFKLAVQACEKTANEIAADVKKLSDKVWQNHVATMRVKLSGVAMSRWDQLIQDGTLRGQSQMFIAVEGKNGMAHPGLFSSSDHALNYKDESHSASSFSPGDLLRQLPALSKCVGRLSFRGRAIQLHAGKTYPAYDSMDVFAENAPEVAEVQRISDRLVKMLREARDMYVDTLSVLDACRTVKQLENILPEAAKLAPKPAAKAKNVMPTELAETIRKRVEGGIPV